MQTTAIVLCSGMDDSLLDVDLPPFEYGTVSPYDMKPIMETGMSYIYNRASGPDGKIVNERRDEILVDTLYDFFHHLFAPLSMARTIYCEFVVKKKDDGTCCSEYQQFRYFRMDTDKSWEDEERCLIDAIRLFKTNRAGFGIGVLPEGGVAVNDMYQCETNYALWRFLPVFTLSESEKKDFQKFYSEFREWYTQFYPLNYGPEPSSKDMLTKRMLDLYRNAYRCNDVETAFIAISGIWELFAQQFPEIWSKNRNRVTERIKQSVSRMIRNGGVVKGKKQANLYKKVGYLYYQRSLLVHKSKDEVFDKECIPMAFDLTRCLILKLFYVKDREIEDIVNKLEYCDEDKAAYKVDTVRWNPVSDGLMERIFRPHNFQADKPYVYK
ncbi:hypothetical protein AR505_1262 [methanogenic archaeon ISO4-H5]|nr:hypothetical protein AR505_1262 [methanogenic archaeon ISO4-H5]